MSLLIKAALFILALGLFWVLGGWDRPVPGPEDYRSASRVGSAWLWTVVLYLAGVLLGVWGEEVSVLLDTQVPGAALRVVGALLAIAGCIWMLMLRGTVPV